MNIKMEIASDCAEVSIVRMHELSKSTGKPIFPNGLLQTMDNDDIRYTEEAQDVYNELIGVFEDIVEEKLKI